MNHGRCQSAFIKHRAMLTLLFMSAMTVSITECLGAKAVINRQKYNEKLEFYKVSYPTFDFRAAQEEAAKTLPLYRKGDKITVTTDLRRVSGTYHGCEHGKIMIDDEIILLRNVPEDEHYRFDPDTAEQRRRAFAEEKFRQYSRKRSDDTIAFRKKIEEEFTVQDEKDDDASPNSTTGAQDRDTPVRALSGIVKTDILSSSGTVRAGELAEQLKMLPNDRCSFITADGRLIQTDVRNIITIGNPGEASDPFAMGQAALRLLLHGNADEAISHAAYARKLPGAEKRAAAIANAAIIVRDGYNELRRANGEINDLNRELEALVRQISRNQSALKDDFAVKAGTRDRSTPLAAQAIIVRERRKQIQSALKERLDSMTRQVDSDVRLLAADGDFIAAATLCDMSVRLLAELRKNAMVEWDEEENARFDSFQNELKAFIPNAYSQAISRPFNDNWSDFLDSHVKIFGYNESELKKYDLKPGYENILAAAQASFADSRLFYHAANEKRFSPAFEHGMKLLLLMPQARISANIEKIIGDTLKQLQRQLDSIPELARENRNQEILAIAREISPTPPDLKPFIQNAEKLISQSQQLLDSARESEKNKDYPKVLSDIRQSLTLWPDNQAAREFYRAFLDAHRDILKDMSAMNLYISQARFADAADKCGLMFKEYPQYRPFIKELRAKLKEKKSEFAADMLAADNLFKAGRLQEALATYRKYNQSAEIDKVLKSMLAIANERGDKQEALRLLEQLGRWDEAGKVRRELN